MATRLFPQDVPSLKTLVLGGEAVRPDNVTDWVDHVRLINSYGPAENTISSTVRLVTPDSSQASNIGKGNGSLTWIVDPVNHNLLTPVVSPDLTESNLHLLMCIRDVSESLSYKARS